MEGSKGERDGNVAETDTNTNAVGVTESGKEEVMVDGDSLERFSSRM
jgi:hypothetical protein